VTATRIKLIQEKYKNKPWRMLVACILLNKTTGQVVREVLSSMFQRWPTPHRMARARVTDVAAAVERCGLQHNKAKHIVWLSAAYAYGHRPPEPLPGVGRYALDSWAIFIDGDLSARPEDKELKRYLREVKPKRRKKR